MLAGASLRPRVYQKKLEEQRALYGRIAYALNIESIPKHSCEDVITQKRKLVISNEQLEYQLQQNIE